MNKPDFVEMWLWCFAANAISNKLKDSKAIGGENEIIDLILSYSRVQSNHGNLFLMIYSKELEDLIFKEI